MVVLYCAITRLGWDLLAHHQSHSSDAFFLVILMCFLLIQANHDEWLEVILLGGLVTGVGGRVFVQTLWEKEFRDWWKL